MKSFIVISVDSSCRQKNRIDRFSKSEAPIGLAVHLSCVYISIESLLQRNPVDTSYSRKPAMTHQSMNILGVYFFLTYAFLLIHKMLF